jgi:flagellar hook-length control protein FliK
MEVSLNVGTGSLGLQSLVKQQRDSLSAASNSNPSLSKSALGGEKASQSFSNVLEQTSQATSSPDRSSTPKKETEVQKNPNRPIRGQNKATAKQQQKTQANVNRGFNSSEVPTDSEIVLDEASGLLRSRTIPVQAKLPNGIEEIDFNEISQEIPVDQAAMMKFLISMKSELGIEPQDILNAMDNLTTEELMKAPEDTMTQVLNGLDLGNAERERAGQLYQTMLKETAVAKLSGWARTNGQDVNMKVMGPEEIKQQKLLASLDRMNQQFFVQDRPVDSQFISTDEMMVTGEQKQGQPVNALPPMADPRSYPSNKGIDQKRKDDFKMPEFFPVVAAPITTQVPGESSTGSVVQAQSLQGLQNAAFMNPAGKTSLEPVGAFSKSPEMIQSMNVASGAVPVTVAVEDDAEWGDSGEESESDSSTFQTGQPQAAIKPGGNLFTQSAMAAPVIAKPGEESANVRNLIQGAQILIQKGGGEMKVKMQPEGMGEVDLKVSVHQGRVDVQMLTDNNDIKKLLESGLSDLKESLVGHKLNLDTVKVDVAQKFHPDLGSQLEQQQREMAREFLGQFRQQNQSNRSGFMDVTGLKNYGARSKVQTPSDVPAASRARETSRRLDLVA